MPLAEGILFSVRPPKKSWKNISNLSGGEKTLSSLSLVFALHHFKPTPLYVMDEIDAALGERAQWGQGRRGRGIAEWCTRQGCTPTWLGLGPRKGGFGSTTRWMRCAAAGEVAVGAP